MFRRLAVLAFLAALVHFVLPQLTQAGVTISAVGRLQWSWVPPIALAAALTYAMAALSLMAASGGGLAFGRTMAAEVAAAFTNRVVPAGVGAMTTNVRYMERAGLTRSRALAAVGLDSAAGFVVHVVALIAVSGLARTRSVRFSVHSPDVPDNWELLAFIAIVLAGAGLALEIRRLRGRWRPAARRALDYLLALVRDPRRGARLLAASAGVTGAYGFALWAAVRAAGGGPSLLAVFVVYLGGSALAAAAPTPGGLGAIEAGLIAGLTAAGQAAPAAVTAVLVYRLITFWLPVLPGAVSFWALRRAGAL